MEYILAYKKSQDQAVEMIFYTNLLVIFILIPILNTQMKSFMHHRVSYLQVTQDDS